MEQAAYAPAADQADHLVTLNYTEDGLSPEPNPLCIKAGQTVAFQLGSAPEGSSFRITFNDPECCSMPVYQPGDLPVVMQPPQSGRIHYDCDLITPAGEETIRGLGGAIEEDRSSSRGN